MILFKKGAFNFINFGQRLDHFDYFFQSFSRLYKEHEKEQEQKQEKYFYNIHLYVISYIKAI